ncbi:MAG: CocE/NonD family hydrolase [Pseudomonadales bacterium]
MSIYRVKHSARQNDTVVVHDVMVPMRDGVHLATDIYFPARDGHPIDDRFPILLYRTPYDKAAREHSFGWNRWFAERGYIAIAQDCRGCYRSEGEVRFLIPEAEDGYDTLQWIKTQPWGDAKVGTWGTSWSGWTQTAMAALGPDNLGAMVPNVSGSDAYSSSVRHNGALELRFIAWAFWHSTLNTQAELKADPAVNKALRTDPVLFREWLSRWPIRRGQTQLALVPPYERWAFELMTRGERDEFWDHPSMNPSKHWQDFSECPCLYVGGWYDSYTRATFENFLGHGAAKRGPVKVLVGPWTHGLTTPELTFAGNVEFGPDAALESFREIHHAWYERYLNSKNDDGEDEASIGMDEDAPIRIFVMGGGSGAKTAEGRLVHGGKWRDELEWPLARTEFTPFYLHGDGRLRPTPPEARESQTSYRFDPDDPVPSIGGNVSSHSDFAGIKDRLGTQPLTPIMHAGGYDQVEDPRFFGARAPYLPLGARADVLVFETEPLRDRVEVTGPVEVNLFVSTSAPDTDFTAKLVDVYPPSSDWPNGYHLNLTDSIQRLRYREDDGTATLAQAGNIYRITIKLYPTSNLFAAGHRIRIDVSSSNFPRFDVNPNTGEPLGLERRKQIATNTLHHDREHTSHVLLPVIPRSG